MHCIPHVVGVRAPPARGERPSENVTRHPLLLVGYQAIPAGPLVSWKLGAVPWPPTGAIAKMAVRW